MKLNESNLKAMLSTGSVKAVDVVRRESGLVVSVTGMNGKAHTLSSKREDARTWQSLDTVDRFLKSLGVGSYSVI